MLLTQPFSLKRLTLPTRLVRSATAESRPIVDEASGTALGEMYRRLGEGGVGLIITGHAAAHRTGRTTVFMPGLFTDAQAQAWRHVFAEAHRGPAPVVAQINHAGGRAHREDLGEEPWCVSPIEREFDSMRGEAMTEEQIQEVIESFARAAVRALEAGADGVQFHGAHGYLVSQFLSPLANFRTDRWGGSVENRARFAIEAARAIRKAIGPEAILGIKLGAADSNPEGLTIEESIQAAKWIHAAARLDFIEVSGAFHSQIARRKIRSEADEAYYLHWAEKFKIALGIPTIAVGGFRTLSVMEDALESGACDMVAVCRPLFRDPGFLEKLLRGEESNCQNCNRCLTSRESPRRCLSF